MTRQPLLHDLAVTLSAPTVVLSRRDGDLDALTATGSAQGLMHADVRALSRLVLTLDGRPVEPLGDVADGPGRHHFVALARHLGDPSPDPTVRVDRHREVTTGGMRERVVVTSWAAAPVDTVLELTVGADLLAIEDVKAGRTGDPVPITADRNGVLSWSSAQSLAQSSAQSSAESSAESSASRFVVLVRGSSGARSQVLRSGAAAVVAWPLHLKPGASVEVVLSVEVDDPTSVVRGADPAATWSRPQVRADDRRLERLVAQSLDDLESLRMTDVASPGEVFVAAGAPWFFTLFGRDSLWVARMLLPLGTDLARSTLRVLARRQGTRFDPASEEEPGKILHELRRATFDDGDGLVLPPVYYGTVDATALWVCLLHDAFRWGLAREDVVPLLPALQAALTWIGAAAQAGGGFLRYVDHSGSGLANQGWKDSGDAVRFADGSLAGPPLALAEVQAYAYEAALGGAALLDAFDIPGAPRWRSFAAELRDRFRADFWVSDGDGRYPAMALDGDGRPADAIASNMGHLLTSGLLADDAEIAAVAERLVSPGMSAGFGLRTMSSASGGYGPLRYHCGTVWPHDTAIAVAGLVRSGHGALVHDLVDGMLAASTAFDGRLPELWSGDARADVAVPLPYPAACRPQAWAAASAVSLVASLLGLDPDVPNGTLAVRPVPGSPVGALSAHGLVVAGMPLDVDVDVHAQAANAARTRVGSAAGLRLLS